MRPKIVIDPGHGGEDPGSSANGLRECDINLLIAKFCRDELSKYDCDIFMTRERDITVQNITRIAMGNGKDLYISLHNNSYHISSANGFETFRFSGALLPKTVEIHKSIHNNLLPLMDALGVRERRDGPATGNYWMLREPSCPCVLIEYMFLSNPREATLLKNNDVLKQLGIQTAIAISKSLNLKPIIKNSYKVMVIASGLHFRTGAGTNFNSISILPRGTILSVVGENGIWLNVKTSSGQIGWVHGEYIKEYIESRKVAVIARVLNLRTEPSVSSAIINGLPRGTVLEVITTSNEWLKVKTLTGQIGWVHGEYIKEYEESHLYGYDNVVEYLTKLGWRVTSDFGWRIHPLSGKRTFHNGIDFGVPRGGVINAPIPTPFPCRVTQTRLLVSRGQTHVSLIDNTKILQLFQHLHSYKSKLNTRLNIGDIVGLCGTTGESTGVHLHYELRVNDGSIIGSSVWGDPKDFRISPFIISGVLDDPTFLIVVGDYQTEATTKEPLQDMIEMGFSPKLLPTKSSRLRLIADSYKDEKVATDVIEGLRDLGYKKAGIIVS